MDRIPLSALVHRLHPGGTLPFDLHDPHGRLLLARGQRVCSAGIEALLARDAGVRTACTAEPRHAVATLPRAELPRYWREALDGIAAVLQDSAAPTFAPTLDAAAQPVLALVERDPDLAIFQLLRRQGGERADYGVRRATATAVTASLVARRLGWGGDEIERAFKAALTMNVAMLGLQGELAAQAAPPTPVQRTLLRSHPLRGRALLERAGVADGDWLAAVERHHEVEDGSGYPRGTREVGELAGLLRRVEVYTAKLAARGHRAALAADVAGRQMFMGEPGHPMVAAIVKEFGIHPPGSWVRLVSGAVGVVVARGPTLATPVVACLVGADGRALAAPLRVDTAQRAHAVAALVDAGAAGRAVDEDELERLVVAG